MFSRSKLFGKQLHAIIVIKKQKTINANQEYICRMKVLMVCLGNICRSPLAEGILRSKADKAGLKWIIDSAGTSAHNVGCSPHTSSQKVARQNGFDISHHRCRNLVQEDLQYFDKIYVMDDENYADVKKIAGKHWNNAKVDYLMNELFPRQNKIIFDPWYGGEDGFYEVYEMMEKACEALIKNYTINNG